MAETARLLEQQRIASKKYDESKRDTRHFSTTKRKTPTIKTSDGCATIQRD